MRLSTPSARLTNGTVATDWAIFNDIQLAVRTETLRAILTKRLKLESGAKATFFQSSGIVVRYRKINHAKAVYLSLVSRMTVCCVRPRFYHQRSRLATLNFPNPSGSRCKWGDNLNKCGPTTGPRAEVLRPASFLLMDFSVVCMLQEVILIRTNVSSFSKVVQY